MKKTSRTFKRFAAITSASLLAACMVAPMYSFAEGEEVTQPTTYTITINNSATGHTYEAYQIFAGTLEKVDGEDVLSDIVWGEGVTSSNTTDPAILAESLSNGMTGKEIVEALGITLGAPSGSVDTMTGSTYVIDGLEPGYYLIKDAEGSLEDDAYDAYTSYIIKVVGNATATPKSAKPEVDKQVYDNADGTTAAGWGETADWTINNNYDGTTQFKLIATIPPSDHLADYTTYKLVFNDVMSTGITFDSIDSVTVAGYEGDVDYDCSATEGMKGNGNDAWTLTIENLLAYDTNLSNGATVEIIYNAHLNEEATITSDSGAIANKNTVGLQYSNNPNNASDLGKAPEDTVWVATYQVLNFKFDGESEEALPGVGFELQDSTGAKIVLAYDATNNVYYPKGANDTAVDLVSGEDGTFNIKGLDAGTYKLVETAPLPGYNTCGDITIVIEATHEEDGAGTGATVEMTKAEGVNNEIENNQGSTLPGTGGIGTTVFYLGGGAMVAVAGIYLISKKRMKNTQE